MTAPRKILTLPQGISPRPRAGVEVFPNPLTHEMRAATVALPGETVAQILTRMAAPMPAAVYLNGVLLPVERHENTPVRAGDSLVVRAEVAGGGGDDSDPLRVALQIAVLVASFYIPGAQGLALQGWKFYAASAAIQLGGSLLVNEIAPLPQPDQPESFGGLESPQALGNINARNNRARPYEPLQLTLGRMRVVGDHARTPYTQGRWWQIDPGAGDNDFEYPSTTPEVTENQQVLFSELEFGYGHPPIFPGPVVAGWNAARTHVTHGEYFDADKSNKIYYEGEQNLSNLAAWETVASNNPSTFSGLSANGIKQFYGQGDTITNAQRIGNAVVKPGGKLDDYREWLTFRSPPDTETMQLQLVGRQGHVAGSSQRESHILLLVEWRPVGTTRYVALRPAETTIPAAMQVRRAAVAADDEDDDPESVTTAGIALRLAGYQNKFIRVDLDITPTAGDQPASARGEYEVRVRRLTPRVGPGDGEINERVHSSSIVVGSYTKCYDGDHDGGQGGGGR